MTATKMENVVMEFAIAIKDSEESFVKEKSVKKIAIKTAIVSAECATVSLDSRENFAIKEFVKKDARIMATVMRIFNVFATLDTSEPDAKRKYAINLALMVSALMEPVSAKKDGLESSVISKFVQMNATIKDIVKMDNAFAINFGQV